jgi:hypothetical protein
MSLHAGTPGKAAAGRAARWFGVQKRVDTWNLLGAHAV